MEDGGGNLTTDFICICRKIWPFFRFRVLCTFCICCTLYGAGCVFIVLIGQCLESLFEEAELHPFGLCTWMPIVAAGLIPLTWLGTPKDFWQIAVGALLSTVAACAGIIIQGLIDHHDPHIESKHFIGRDLSYPDPTFKGSIKAFATIMFAFAGASTFPTIQADMKKKEHFKISAYIACISKY